MILFFSSGKTEVILSTMMTDFGEQIPVPESLYNVICDAVQQSDHETINQTLYRFDE